MSCQDILAMRKLITQKYEEYEPHLNPFCSLLFSENWSWPSSYLPQNFQIKTKNTTNKTSLKTEITSWFLELGSQQKCAFTAIKNPKFLIAFLQTYQKWNPDLLYQIHQKRQIPNYLTKNLEVGSFQTIVDHLRIAWLDQPVLYFQVKEEQIQGLFLEMMNWADDLSGSKLFQYAHKIKNKSDPEQNLLWFTEQSFQQLPAWLVNQLERVMIKNYFDRNNFDADIYQKIGRLRSGSQKFSANTNPGTKKQLQKLLCMKIEDACNYSHSDFMGFQEKLKVYEDQYYQEVALLMDYQNSGNAIKEEDNRKKKKKNKKKKTKSKSRIQSRENLQSNQEIQNQLTSMQQLDSKQKEEQQQIPNNQNDQDNDKNNDNDNGQEQIAKPEQILQNQKIGEFEQILEISNQVECHANLVCEVEENRDNHIDKQMQNLDKISIFEQLSSQSLCSSSQSNILKLTNKSGKSHPGFNTKTNQSLQKDQKRSLPHKKNNNASSQRSNKKNHDNFKASKNNNKNKELDKTNVIYQNDSISNSELNNQSSYLEESNICSSENFREFDFKEDQINTKIEQKDQNSNNQDTQSPQPNKKRKRKNKNQNIIKQLSNKICCGLITRQLNNFVDSLSTQTNNLYDHKRVAFERVRCFIQSIFPTTQAMLFGSNAVGLSLPTSDIDIMLFNLPCASKQEATEILAHLAVQIHAMGWVVSCSAYLNAKVPLVKLEIDPSINYLATKRRCDYMMGSIFDPRIISHLELKPNKKDNFNKHNINNHHNYHSAGSHLIHQGVTQQKQYHFHHGQNNKIIKVDLSVNLNDQGNLGAQSTQLMKSWMSVYPQIHRAILAFKYILAQRGYSSNFKGGIGSYCLFIMVAAFITQYPEMQQLDDGEFFMAILKFYGQDFENKLKSITLRSAHPQTQPQDQDYQKCQKKSCFISLQQTYSLINTQYLNNPYMTTYMHSPQEDLYHFLNTFKDNPLRIFDPINSRIMSGNCQLYPQIKTEFRRIYKELKQIQYNAQKDIQITINKAQAAKMLENKKSVDKWLNKYQIRSGFQIKKVFDGQC